MTLKSNSYPNLDSQPIGKRSQEPYQQHDSTRGDERDEYASQPSQSKSPLAGYRGLDHTSDEGKFEHTVSGGLATRTKGATYQHEMTGGSNKGQSYGATGRADRPGQDFGHGDADSNHPHRRSEYQDLHPQTTADVARASYGSSTPQGGNYGPNKGTSDTDAKSFPSNRGGRGASQPIVSGQDELPIGTGHGTRGRK